LAGSYFVENLTNETEEAAWKLINKIDAMGGSVSAIEAVLYRKKLLAVPTSISATLKVARK
jgi:methylmalonyl-CoA mutase N-terminal domain/subunit